MQHTDGRPVSVGSQWDVDRLMAEYGVSVETLVRVLARKGLVTPAELAAEEEARRRQRREQEAQLARVITEHHVRSSSHGEYRRPRSWLKRVMAKRRWTRRLGTFLFGWKWKKVYRRSSSHSGLGA